MDSIDAKIIKLLKEDSRISISELSKQVNLSRPSIQDRIQKLIDNDVISGFTIINKPQKMGYKIAYFVMISEIKIPVEKLIAMLQAHNKVIEIYCVSGKVNYLIKAVAIDIEDMHAFLKELRDFSLVETMLVLEEIRANLNLEPII